MPDYQEIESAAKHWIERYGKEALEQLTLRLDELEKFEKPEAHELWLEIFEEVKVQIKDFQF
jgi:bifunctional DNase/RNase